MEEKYKKAMVSNAQLDNEKANLIYQVDTLKDVIEEMEEQTAEMRRELEEKSKVKTSAALYLESKNTDELNVPSVLSGPGTTEAHVFGAAAQTGRTQRGDSSER